MWWAEHLPGPGKHSSHRGSGDSGRAGLFDRRPRSQTQFLYQGELRPARSQSTTPPCGRALRRSRRASPARAAVAESLTDHRQRSPSPRGRRGVGWEAMIWPRVPSSAWRTMAVTRAGLQSLLSDRKRTPTMPSSLKNARAVRSGSSPTWACEKARRARLRLRACPASAAPLRCWREGLILLPFRVLP